MVDWQTILHQLISSHNQPSSLAFSQPLPMTVNLPNIAVSHPPLYFPVSGRFDRFFYDFFVCIFIRQQLIIVVILVALFSAESFDHYSLIMRSLPSFKRIRHFCFTNHIFVVIFEIDHCLQRWNKLQGLLTLNTSIKDDY